MSQSIELSSRNPELAATNETGPERNSTEAQPANLPPTDQGKAAWLVLTGCCLIQAPVWGYQLAFGVIQEYLSTHHEFNGSTSDIANIGTTASGVMYLTSPLLFTTLTKYPHLRRWCGPLGLLLSALGLLTASFATTITHLILLQGVLMSLGNGLLFTPTTLYLDSWFHRRKGLAIGIMWSGKSLSGACIPFIVSAGLDRFGYRALMRGWAVALVLMTAPILPVMRPRIPVSRSRRARPLSWRFLREPTFWVLQAGNVMQSLGYFLPTTYLASYAARVGQSSLTGTVLIALLNGTSVLGSLVIGPLADHWRVSTVILVCSMGSVVSVFLFWGFAGGVALLVMFSIAYGFFAGGFSTTWSAVMKEVQRADEGTDTGLVFGLLAGGRGLGSVVSGPLSVALLNSGWASGSKGGYGTEYGPVILFTGATALFGGWGWLQRWL